MGGTKPRRASSAPGRLVCIRPRPRPQPDPDRPRLRDCRASRRPSRTPSRGLHRPRPSRARSRHTRAHGSASGWPPFSRSSTSRARCVWLIRPRLAQAHLGLAVADPAVVPRRYSLERDRALPAAHPRAGGGRRVRDPVLLEHGRQLPSHPPQQPLPCVTSFPRADCQLTRSTLPPIYQSSRLPRRTRTRPSSSPSSTSLFRCVLLVV